MTCDTDSEHTTSRDSTEELSDSEKTSETVLRFLYLAGFCLFISFFWVVIGLRTLPPASDIKTALRNDDFPGLESYKHVEIIAQAPHPVGSDALWKVHNYLWDTILNFNSSRLIFATTRLTDPPKNATGPDGLFYNSTVLESYINKAQIIVILPGLFHDTVLLSAHFDSVKTSYGAADDGL
jgi:hypothetical protein